MIKKNPQSTSPLGNPGMLVEPHALYTGLAPPVRGQMAKLNPEIRDKISAVADRKGTQAGATPNVWPPPPPWPRFNRG
jgi:hypothetical protein